MQYLNFFDNKVKNIKCFLVDEKIFSALNLPYYADKNKNKSFASLMWYCADYVFYAVKKYFPDYDYYWQLEYDVFCNGSSYKPFFERYNQQVDLITTGLNKVEDNSKWCWVEKTDWIYDDTQLYSSFFPIVRLSASAIDFLYKRRIEMSEIFSGICKSKQNRWLHCELFVPTELLNNNFTSAKLNEPLRLTPNYDLNEERIFENPDYKIYHPVKGNYELSLSNLQSKIKRFEKHKLSVFGYYLGFYIEKKVKKY